jgi:hypothetical protein
MSFFLLFQYLLLLHPSPSVKSVQRSQVIKWPVVMETAAVASDCFLRLVLEARPSGSGGGVTVEISHLAYSVQPASPIRPAGTLLGAFVQETSRRL